MTYTRMAVALLFLCAASPPAWIPGGGILVLIGWMAFYAQISADETEVRSGRWRRFAPVYLIGLGHMLYFSFSVRHVLLPGYVAIGLLGGLYYVLAAVWTATLRRFLPGAVAFGIALAGVHWLRGHFVEIQYPHVQPAHCLYEWPVLLGGLRWGSEVTVNLLLGAIAAGSVDLYRAWRVGRPGYRGSAVTLVAVFAVCFSLSIPGVGHPSEASASIANEPEVRIVLIEPRTRPRDMYAEDRQRIFHERVIQPTLLVAGPGVADPPDLVLWPESAAVRFLFGSAEAPELRELKGSPRLRLASATRLLEGTSRIGIDRRTQTVVALLVDGEGNYVGHQEKRNVVPGGEHAPFLDWLPKGASDWVRDTFERSMGVALPEISAGEERPLLETASGVKFGAMVCFDNAFPEPAEEMAAQGASFLVVISNESWYMGGAELHQMEAMSVCRALETRLPIVRCTVDGASIVVDPDGVVRHGLPFPVTDYGSGEKLEVRLKVGAGRQGAVPWIRPIVQWTVLATLLLVVARTLGSWGRLLRSGSRRDAATPESRPQATSPNTPISGP